MKVLHSAETIKGGVATVVKLLCQGTAELLPQAEIRCLVPASQSSELSALPSGFVATFKDSGRGIYTAWRFALAFIGQLVSYKPDVVHLHSSFAGAIGRVCLILLYPWRRPRVIYCPHAFAFLMEGSSLKKRLYATVELFLLRVTDVVVCVSEYERSAAATYGLSSPKLKLIRNGTPPPHQSRPPAGDRAANGHLQLLFVGRFDHQKGFDVLLEAMGKITDRPVQLTIIGGSVLGGYSKAERPNITYVDWLPHDQLVDYFNRADALVIPSRWEGFAMVPLEAMSHGLAVISSDFPSLKEALREGITGHVFPVGDSDGLAKVLATLDVEECARLGQNGRKFYLQNFTADRMCRETLSIYR